MKKRIPIREWNELDRKNAIVARMVADRLPRSKWNGQEDIGSEETY